MGEEKRSYTEVLRDMEEKINHLNQAILGNGNEGLKDAVMRNRETIDKHLECSVTQKDLDSVRKTAEGNSTKLWGILITLFIFLGSFVVTAIVSARADGALEEKLEHHINSYERAVDDLESMIRRNFESTE